MANKKARGKRSNTRRKLKGGKRQSVSQLVRTFEENESVQIRIDPSHHSGMPAAKFHGVSGKVSAKRGKVYEVAVKDRKASRTLVVHAAHMKSMTLGAKEEKSEAS